MEIVLERIKSERCYLQGRITIENEFICDSMEFNNESTLKRGSYNVKLLREPKTNLRRVYIFGNGNLPVSKLTIDNTEHQGKIKIRKKNSLIEIGLLNKTYGLVMFSYVDEILQNKILKSLAKNENVEFSVLNEISDNFYEEVVTQY
jgi:hypothetical protein